MCFLQNWWLANCSRTLEILYWFSFYLCGKVDFFPLASAAGCDVTSTWSWLIDNFFFFLCVCVLVTLFSGVSAWEVRELIDYWLLQWVNRVKPDSAYACLPGYRDVTAISTLIGRLRRHHRRWLPWRGESERVGRLDSDWPAATSSPPQATVTSLAGLFEPVIARLQGEAINGILVGRLEYCGIR